MNTKPNDFKLGLFILGGIAILLAALFVFGVSKFFEGKTIEETYVEGSVEGLKSGAPVLLRGVPVGEVTHINFSWNVYHVREPRYVVVEFEVGNKVSLVPPGRDYAKRVEEEVNKGLRARIKSQGLAGATILSLEYVRDTAGSPPLRVTWRPQHVYIPSAPGQFSQIIASLDHISANLKEVNFQKIGEQVQRDLGRVDVMLKHFDQTDISGLSTNLNSLVMDLRGISAGLQVFVGQTNELARANLPAISADATNVLVGLTHAVGKLDRIASGLNEASLNESLENIRRATLELQQAIHKFREYPAGTLFGKPPPPARSVELPRG